MTYKRTFLSFASFLFATTSLVLATDQSQEKTPAVSENTPVVSLEDTLSRTYMQNTDLDAQRAQLRQTDETVNQALDQWRPSVSVQGAQNRNGNFPTKGRNSFGGNTNVQTQVNQNIFAGGGTVASTKKAESTVMAGRSELTNQEQTSLFQAVQSFFNVIARREIVEARKKNEEFLRQTLEQTQARYEVGEVSRGDVAAAEASYAQATAQRVQAVGDYEVAQATFYQVVGSPAGNLVMPKLLLPIPDKLTDAQKIALAKNPAIFQARHALEAAQHNVDVQLAGLLPTVNMSGTSTTGRATQSPPRREAKGTDLSAQVVVSVPLYSQGIPSSQVRQAYQAVGQSKVQLEGVRRAVRKTVTEAWDSLLAARKAVEQYVASVRAQKLAVEGVTEEAAVGIRTVLDILEQEKRYIDTEVELIQADQSLMVASYQVLQSMGQLTARELGLNVKYYDPEKHYNDVKWASFQFWEGEDERYVRDEDEGTAE